MCGRFALSVTPEALARFIQLLSLPPIRPRFNIAPTQDIGIVRLEDGQRVFANARWGLPAPRRGGPPLINARGETLFEKPSFAPAARLRRCLVPANGFYEWRSQDGRRQASLFRRPNSGPFAFAGIWDPDRADRPCAAIVTCGANATVAPIHHRMPVILPPVAFAPWLAPDSAAAALQALLVPAADTLLAAIAVGPRINQVRHDDASCWDPPAPPAQQSLFGAQPPPGRGDP